MLNAVNAKFEPELARRMISVNRDEKAECGASRFSPGHKNMGPREHPRGALAIDDAAQAALQIPRTVNDRSDRIAATLIRQ
jgi:hypothetical protein